MATTKKDLNYFDMLVKGAGYALTAANILKDMFDSGRLLESKIASIRKIEQDADNHMHLLCDQLNNAFITPLDKDDIYSIAKETDDITDGIDSAASLLWMMRISSVTPAMKLMADYIVKACNKLAELMSHVKHRKKYHNIREDTVEMNHIKKMGDKCYKEAMRVLFEREKEAVEIIKLKEVYSGLMTVLNSCEYAADCVLSITITKT